MGLTLQTLHQVEIESQEGKPSSSPREEPGKFPSRSARKLLERRPLILILLFSAILRIILVWRGGAHYWLDEGRFNHAVRGLAALCGGHFGEGLGLLVLTPAHQFFGLVSLLPAAVHAAAAILFGWPLLDYRVAAAVYSFSSVAVIALIYALAREAGADKSEAVLAAFLAACSNALFYWSRHLMPYDTSMALGLLAILFALKRDAPFRRTVWTGFLAAACFLVYNGSYTMSVLAGLVCVFGGWPDVRNCARRCAGFACGAASPVAFLFGLGLLRRASPIESTGTYLGTINQGDFSEGWRVPLAYLWHAEHGIAIAWALACVAALVLLFLRVPGARRAGFWLAAAVALYAMLAIASNVFHRFYVYGRTVRPMVPFLCLTAAFVLRTLSRQGRSGRLGAAALLAAGTIAAAVNFVAPFRMVFPQQVAAAARLQYGAIREQSTCEAAVHLRPWLLPPGSFPVSDGMLREIPGPLRNMAAANLRKLKDEAAQASALVQAGDPASRYVLLNAEMPFFFHPASCGSAPKGAILGRWQDPMKYEPSQYEGMTPEVRTWFRSLDYTMTLVRLPAETSVASTPSLRPAD